MGCIDCCQPFDLAFPLDRQPLRLAGLDELQNLGAQTTSTTLAVQRLEDQAGSRGEITGLGALPGLAITIPSLMEQMMSL